MATQLRLIVLALVCLPSLLTGCAVHPTESGTAPVITPEPLRTVTHAWTPDMFVPESPRDAAQLAQTLRPAEQQLKSWTELTPTLRANLTYALHREPEQVAVAHGDLAITWGEIARTLTRLQELLPRLDHEPGLFAAEFHWLRLAEGAAFSGYYEPVFKASRTRKPGYAHPIYRLPPDLKQMDLGLFRPEYIGQRLPYRLKNGVPVPYYTRAEIDGSPDVQEKSARSSGTGVSRQGVLRGKGLELAWLADPLDVYFLHVQGSGRLRFSDGAEVPVRFAGSNGRPYLSIGKYLSGLNRISPDNVSMQSIRQWLIEHPEEQQSVLSRNNRYIFFSLESKRSAASGKVRPANSADSGPIGSMGVPIQPWITLAVDRTTFPLGAVLAFEVPLPNVSTPPQAEGHTLFGLGLAQDSGEAIRGRRVDLFCGRGEQAAAVAGRLNTPGEVWLLLAK